MWVGGGMAETCKYYMWASRWLCHTQGGVSLLNGRFWEGGLGGHPQELFEN